MDKRVRHLVVKAHMYGHIDYAKERRGDPWFTCRESLIFEELERQLVTAQFDRLIGFHKAAAKIVVTPQEVITETYDKSLLNIRKLVRDIGEMGIPWYDWSALHGGRELEQTMEDMMDTYNMVLEARRNDPQYHDSSKES